LAASRAQSVVRGALGQCCGVLLTDGSLVYDRFAQTVNRLVQAQGWSHTRRHFVDAERTEPRLVAEALARIGAFSREEAYLRAHGLEAEAQLAHRGEYTKPRVAAFFAWLNQTLLTQVRLPSHPFTRGRIAPRGAARAQVPRSAARHVPVSGWTAQSPAAGGRQREV